jgi:arylsulfatase A-like enzyme
MMSDRARNFLAPAAALLGTVSFGLAIVIWFQGDIILKLAGGKIELVEPSVWWWGTLLWVGALLLWPAPPRLGARISGGLVRIVRVTGVDLATTAARYTAAGIVAGGVAGIFFLLQYLYLVPPLGPRLLLVVAAAALSGLLHRGYALALSGLAARVSPGHPWRNAAGRLSLYLCLWGVAIAWPLRQWEARGTEPLVPGGLLGLAVGLLLCWLFLVPWRAPGGIGRARRWAVAVVAAAGLAASLWSWRTEAQKLHPDEPVRLRVLLVTMDTTRADYLSCYGYGRKTSPNLDRLAASGVRFTRAFCNIGMTDPSHASILTGTYPRTHGLLKNHQEVTGRVPSMAEVFLDRGFTTAAIVSREHVLPVNLNIPGFTEMQGVKMWMGQTSARETFRRVANFLLQHRDQDLFLWVHFFDPHGPYEPHPGISDAFIAKNRGPRRGRKFLQPGQEYSEKEIKYRRDLYAGEIFYLDYYLGQLFDLLNNLEPKAQNQPLILVTADHGEFLGEYQDRPAHLGFGHGPVFNPGVHIPLIVSWPGMIPSGKAVSEVAESVDVAPTLLDYALGYHAYPGQGASLRPAIEGGPTDGLASILGAKGKSQIVPLHALLWRNFKLMTWANGANELYDLDRDFDERSNLAAARPDLVLDLTRRYRAWESLIPETKAVERELTPSEKKTLRALGYVDD